MQGEEGDETARAEEGRERNGAHGEGRRRRDRSGKGGKAKGERRKERKGKGGTLVIPIVGPTQPKNPAPLLLADRIATSQLTTNYITKYRVSLS